MSDSAAATALDVRKRWRWFGVALFLLIPLDLFTTLLAVATYGIAVEANPVMRWLLRHGLFATTVVNLLVVAVVTAMFHVVIEWISRLPPSDRRPFAVGVDVWTAALIVGGVLVVSNNLLAIV